MPEFADLMRQYRERTGLSQRALARSAGINPAIISRMESGDRGPSGPDQVIAVARALSLGPEQADVLLSSAGYWPQSLLSLGPADQSLLTVARVLTSPLVSEKARARFRHILRLLAEEWMNPEPRG